jgi:hypothetical protein
VENHEELSRNLPKKVVGDLSRLNDDIKFRRTLVSFIKRLAHYCNSALLTKRLGEVKKKKRVNGKRGTIYGYKLAVPLKAN